MKRFFVLLVLARAPGWLALAAGPFPWWFHTRPKPVLVEQQELPPTNTTSRTPAPHRVPVANPGAQRPMPQPASAQPSRQSWLAQLFSRPAR